MGLRASFVFALFYYLFAVSSPERGKFSHHEAILVLGSQEFIVQQRKFS
jgi:hypothetical protein